MRIGMLDARWVAVGLVLGASALASCDVDFAPDLTLSGPNEVIAGDTLLLEVTVTDDQELATLRVAWGDGGVDTVALDGPDEQLQLGHAYGRLGEFVIGVALEDAGGNVTEGETSVTVTAARIEVSPGTADLNALGDTVHLSAAVLSATGDTLNADVEWSSGNGAVATVAAGSVASVGTGSVEIRASAGGRSGTASITVRQVPAALELEPSGLTLAYRSTYSAVVAVRDSNGFALPDPDVAWQSADNTVVTVDPAGTFSAVAEGSTTVTATAAAGRLSDSMNVDVVFMVTFVRNRPEGDVIVMAPRDGSASPPFDDLGAGYGPTWSRDGQRLAYSASANPGGSFLFVQDGPGGEPVQVETGGSAESWPSWSPDGQRLAFESWRDGHADIYVVGIDGTGLQRLTSDTVHDRTPAWSPDGTTILFASSRNGLADIFAFDLASSQLTNLTNDPNNFQQDPAWSPDGTRIAYIDTRDANFHLHLMEPDGTHLSRLSDIGPASSPSWSPDGEWIAFIGLVDGNQDLYVIRPDGTDLLRLTADEEIDQAPDWR